MKACRLDTYKFLLMLPASMSNSESVDWASRRPMPQMDGPIGPNKCLELSLLTGTARFRFEREV